MRTTKVKVSVAGEEGLKAAHITSYPVTAKKKHTPYKINQNSHYCLEFPRGGAAQLVQQFLSEDVNAVCRRVRNDVVGVHYGGQVLLGQR